MEPQNRLENPHRPLMRQPQQAVAVPVRRDFIPSWCPWINATEEQLETQVWVEDARRNRVDWVVNGVSVKVSTLPPERRFCIEPDGKIMAKRDFWELLELKFVDTFVIAGVKQVGDASLIPKPAATTWASEMIDPTNPKKLVTIGWDPLKLPPPDAKKRTRLDALKDPVASPMHGLVQVKEGVIHAAKEVETPQSQINTINQLISEGILSETEGKAAKKRVVVELGWSAGEAEAPSDPGGSPPAVTPSGGSAGEEAPPVSPANPSEATLEAHERSAQQHETKHPTRCGAEFSKRSSVGKHEAHCQKCKALKAEDTEAA